MIKLFHDVCQQCSKAVTERYSTSFSSAIRLLHPDLRVPIYNIYGFVRFADEIVDTFHQYRKEELLTEFRKDTYAAIERGISLNPILHSFQITVREYNISHDLIDAFFKSMEMDLSKTEYNSCGYKEYIYGSAEVVGLMCLYVFCEGDAKMYNELKPSAQSLGAAFQKVFTPDMKQQIEDDISRDFEHAYEGILRLPHKARFGVYVAYKYYLSLFKKIKRTTPATIMEQRIRIPNYGKAYIVAKAGLRSQLNLY